MFYGGFDQRPAVIIRPADTQEVAQVVTLARDRGMELAVRSGGHSSAGHSLTDGGIVLDLSELTGLDMARVPVEATAFAHRHRRIMVNLAAFYDGPADRARRQAWVDDFAAALDQGDTGAYVNFLGDERPDRVRQAYPGSTWHRLVQVKRRYDPGNLFRRNQNIPPGGE